MVPGLAPPLSRASSSSSLSSLESVFSHASMDLIPSDEPPKGLLDTRVEVMGIATLSPPASPTRPQRKRKPTEVFEPSLVEQYGSPPAKKTKGSPFTTSHAIFIAEQLMDPVAFGSLHEPGAKYCDQRLTLEFFRRFAEIFNNKFETSVSYAQIRGKMARMKFQWRATHRQLLSFKNKGLPRSALESLIKERCPYYYTLEPALVQLQEDGRVNPAKVMDRPDPTVISDAVDDGNDEQSVVAVGASEDKGADNEEQVQVDIQATLSTIEPKNTAEPTVVVVEADEQLVDSQATLNTSEPKNTAEPAVVVVEADEDKDGEEEQVADNRVTSGTSEPAVVKTFPPRPQKDKNDAITPQTLPDEMDLLDMLKDIKDTSMLQCEAEKEQTRREQLRFQERARAQQETNRLEQLRIEEATKREQLRFDEIRLREEELTKRERLYIENARMRVEETKLREEETTKREEIRADVEKMKEQVRMKELEIEHTTKLLLLEELRLKRAIVEKEGFTALRFKEY